MWTIQRASSGLWIRRMLPVLAALAFSGSALAAAPDKKTERLWKAKCASCHGTDGKGDSEQGKKMKVGNIATAEWQKKNSDAQVREVILKGITPSEKDGVKKQMDGYKDDLTPEQVDALVQFIRALPSAG